MALHCAGFARRGAHLFPRSVAKKAPAEAAPGPAGVHGAAREPRAARRTLAFGHRLGRLFGADARSARCVARLAQSRWTRRDIAAAAMAHRDAFRKTWRKAWTRRLGPALRTPLSTPQVSAR